MSKISDFKNIHKSFLEALRYMNKHNERLKKDPKKYEKVKYNFVEKFEKPLDIAWNDLSPDEQKSLAPLYLYRKAQTDPQVQEILEDFNGKVVDFTPINEED